MIRLDRFFGKSKFLRREEGLFVCCLGPFASRRSYRTGEIFKGILTCCLGPFASRRPYRTGEIFKGILT